MAPSGLGEPAQFPNPLEVSGVPLIPAEGISEESQIGASLPGPIRAVTLNLLHQAESWPRRAPLVEASLCTLAPDIALLQEVAWPDEQAHTLAATLGRATGRGYMVHLTALVRADGWQEGLAILSRFPVVAAGDLEPPGSARVCQHARLDVDGRLLDVYSAHLDPRSSERRIRQAEVIMHRMMEPTPAQGVLLGGDLNAIPEGGAVGLLTAHLRSAYRAVHGNEPDHTFPTPFRERVRRRIGSTVFDYLLYSPGTLAPVSADLAFTSPAPDDPALYPSDHYGLVADLRWLV